MLTTSIMASVLLVFYLFLLIRWDKVKRPGMLRFGLLGFGLMLLGNFFFIALDRDFMIAGQVLHYIGLIPVFIGAIGACRPEILPVLGPAEEEANKAVNQVLQDIKPDDSQTDG